LRNQARGIWTSLLVILLIVVIMAITDNIYEMGHENYNYSDFVKDMEDGDISYVEVYQNQSAPTGEVSVSFKDEDKQSLKFYVTDVTEVESAMRDAKFVNYYVHDVSTQSWFITIIPYILICVMFFIMMVFMSGQNAAAVNSGNSKLMNFGKASARMSMPTDKKVTFADVAGLKEERRISRR